MNFMLITRDPHDSAYKIYEEGEGKVVSISYFHWGLHRQRTVQQVEKGCMNKESMYDC